jgi:hypothetical protein
MPEAPAWRVGVKLPGLRWWRTRRGLNQTELAQKMNSRNFPCSGFSEVHTRIREVAS